MPHRSICVTELLIESVPCVNQALICRISGSLMSRLVSWILAEALSSLWGHFGLLGARCLMTLSAEVTWHLGVPRSSAHSFSQNVRSFHTARCEFPADSSSPLDAKRMPPLGVMAATLVIRSGTGCFVCFPQMFYFVLLASCTCSSVVCSGAAYSVSSCRSFVRRCYSLAGTCEHYSLSVCQREGCTLQGLALCYQLLIRPSFRSDLTLWPGRWGLLGNIL